MKKLVSLVCTLVVVSMVLAGSLQTGVYAQTVPKPSVPEFTFAFVESSFDVPTTSYIDPYTGENITNLGYRENDTTAALRVKNQPFTPLTLSGSYPIGGSEVKLYFQVRYRGQFENDNWVNLFAVDDHLPFQSGLNDTFLPLSNFASSLVTNGGKVELQVQALLGLVYVNESRVVYGIPNHYEFIGTASDWSTPQTLTVGSNITQISTVPFSSSTPTIPPVSPSPPSGNGFTLDWEQTVIAIATAVIAVLVITVVLWRKKA